VISFVRALALASYFGLMFTLITWVILPEHSESYPTYALLMIALFPLLPPLRGLLHGRPYTHAWYSFLLLFYFSHGVGELYSQIDFNIYPLLEIIFSTISFASSITYIKLDANLRASSQK
jgi:uncharacterized membrane protein